MFRRMTGEMLRWGFRGFAARGGIGVELETLDAAIKASSSSGSSSSGSSSSSGKSITAVFFTCLWITLNLM